MSDERRYVIIFTALAVILGVVVCWLWPPYPGNDLVSMRPDYVFFVGVFALLALGAIGVVAFVLVSYAKIATAQLFVRRRTVRATFEYKSTRVYPYEPPQVAMGLAGWLIARVRGRQKVIEPAYLRWASFRVGHRCLQFVVPEDVFMRLETDQAGELTFKGERFIGFRTRPAPRSRDRLTRALRR
jgi:hypothetical protein